MPHVIKVLNIKKLPFDATQIDKIWFSSITVSFKILGFDFDSLFCTKFSNVGIHFLMFVTSQSIGACIYSTPNHIWEISVTWAENQINIPENSLYLLHQLGNKDAHGKLCPAMH